MRKSEFYEKRRDEKSRSYDYRRVPPNPSPRSVFGARLRLARLAAGLPQDKLGVKAGLDEGTASARISRYESGIHEPNISFAHRLADELGVPVPYFYAADDELAKLILWFGQLDTKQRKLLLEFASHIKSSS
jgi:transcriptional regulator with XRE-family HTH domain